MKGEFFMRLFICEKKLIADAIAEALSGNIDSTGNNTIVKGNDVIIWCAGHMLTLKDPEDYDAKYKKWKQEDLPIYFENWGNKIGIDESKTKGGFTKAKRVEQIGFLLRKADIVVNAGDMDEEGQLLIDELLRWFSYKGPVKRLDTADTSKGKLQKKLNEMKDNEQFVLDGWSAYARGVADKIFGYNMTRYYTLLNKNQGILSVGRVQTPTLGLVVNRDEQIENHQKVIYYELFENVVINGQLIRCKFFPVEDNPELIDGKILEPEWLKKKSISLKGKQITADITKKKMLENAPLPFNLTELNSYCSRCFGYKPNQVMKITQSLRETYKAITYNRSDCQYLSEEHFREAPTTIAKVVKNLGYCESDYNSSLHSRCFNDDNITAHFAIIPTSAAVNLDILSEQERNVYVSICNYYLAQFLPPAQKEKTELTVDLGNGEKLKASYVDIVSPGYLTLLEYENSKKGKGLDVLKNISEGKTAGQIQDAEIEEKQTKPPMPYTQATLYKDMTMISKYVKNPEMKKLLLAKDEGKKGECGSIGTSATRAMIITGLIRHGFLEEKKKGKKDILISTEKGRKFYHMLPEEIKTADVTAKWWVMQEDIKKGESTVNVLLDSVLETVRGVIKTGADIVDHIEDETDYGKCPECGKALVRRTGKNGFFVGCSGYPECGCWFIKKKAAKIVGICPKCGNNLVERKGKYGKFVACSNYPSCQYIKK